MSRLQMPPAAHWGTMELAQTDALAKRGRAHTHLRDLLERRSSILHARERETIVDAADALLFDEPDGWE
jgi:hypothetical protein